jgi:hypothetical protein
MPAVAVVVQTKMEMVVLQQDPVAAVLVVMVIPKQVKLLQEVQILVAAVAEVLKVVVLSEETVVQVLLF